MRTDFAELVFTVDDFLSADECRALIERSERIGYEPASVKLRGGPVLRSDIRNNDRIAFADLELAAQLWQRAAPLVPAQLESGVASGLDPGFRAYRYDPGQRFQPHRDGHVARGTDERSLLTCLIYLNDDFSGGATTFYAGQRFTGETSLVASIAPRTGTVLFFRHTWWHAGTPIEAGRKYVLRTDVFYRFAEGLSRRGE